MQSMLTPNFKPRISIFCLAPLRKLPFFIVKRIMPPKPFPFPISVGNDICQISRIFHLLNGQHKNRFLSKLFTAKELNAFRTRIFLQDGEEQDYQKFKSLKSVKREDLTGSSKSMQSTGPEGEIQTESVASFEELRKAHPNFWKRASFVAGR